MELRSLALFLGLCLLAVTQCSGTYYTIIADNNKDNDFLKQSFKARHAMERRDANDDDIFAADEALDDDGTQNDDFDERISEVKDEPAIQATITTRPKYYEAKIGSDQRLECNVDPDNGTVVQWFKNNTLIFIGGINLGQNDRYSMVHNSKDLFIKDVKPSDGSVYRCEVAQETDPVKVEHTLIVLEAPEIIRFTATNNGNILEGDNLLLTCDTRGKPPPQIVWSRTSDNGNQRLGEQDGEFSVNSVYMKNVRREHSGKYYCYAFNSVGSNQSELLVSVAGKPRVHVHKTVVNSAINVEAVLQCSAHYEANPHIRWYKDGLLIEDSSTKYDISTDGPNSNLTVTPTTAADFGVYTCEAENNIGKHNRSIELVLKPVIESLGVESGKLTWTIHSHLPLQEVTAQVHELGNNGNWREFVIPLPSTHHHKYDLIFDLHDKIDAGKYEALVKVKNDHSWSDAVDPVVFDIELEPEPIQHASVYGGDSHSIRPSSIIMSSMLMYLLVRLL